MKCELVAALLHHPRVLFLDEPTIGLDVMAQKNIRDLIQSYNQEHQTTILLTSHYMEDIQQLCDRVILMDKGKIVYDGTLEALIKHYAPHKLLKVTFEAKGVKREAFEKFGDIQEFTPFRCIIKTKRLQAKQTAISLLSSSLPIDDILIDEMGIDDIIRAVFSL